MVEGLGTLVVGKLQKLGFSKPDEYGNHMNKLMLKRRKVGG